MDRNPGPASGTGEMGGQGIPLEQGLWGSSEADEGGGGSRAKPPRGGTGGTARHTGDASRSSASQTCAAFKAARFLEF